MYLEELIETKWKPEKDNEEGKSYVVMKEISNETYLHTLCKKIDMSYYDNFEQQYNIRLLPELKEFYKNYNGCRLFLSSINIYGIGVGKSSPMEFYLNDINKHGEIKDKKVSKETLDDIVFFGGVGEYEMYYKQSELMRPKIYLAKNGTIVPSKEFDSIEDVMKYYFKYLVPEYDEKGYRKHPNKDKWCKKYPVISNSFWGDITWTVSEEDSSKTNQKG